MPSAVSPVASVTGGAGTTEDVISPVVIGGVPASSPYEGGGARTAASSQRVGLPDYDGVSSSVVARSPAAFADDGVVSGLEVVGNAGALSDNVAADGSESVATKKSSGVVKGFASKVPLAVALRQILPNGYAFSIDPNVDMGTLISFQGGRPWRETLQESIVPAGLVMRERGQMVAIGYPSGKSASGVPSSRVKSSRSGVATQVSDSEPSRYQMGTAPRDLGGVEQEGGFSADVSDDGYAPQARMSPSYSDTVSTQVSGPRVWTAARGASLRRILESWCARAHVEFNWLAEYDYPLQASATFRGTFEDAVRSLLIGFENAQPQPVASLHANPRLGQMVLVVQSRGNTNSD
ncbi:MAG: TcpQ domain-containing protein [Bdellovibrionales bacterium]